MLTLDYSALHRISSRHGLTKAQLNKIARELPRSLRHFHTRGENWHTLPDDKNTVRELQRFARAMRGHYRDVVVLGMGGSALGTICLRHSLKHLFDHELDRQPYPRLHVLNNVDPTFVRELEDIIELKQTLFIVVSKSGTTPEVVSQFLYFQDRLCRRRLPLREHFVFITDPDEKSVLHRIALDKRYTVFPHAPVGGRYAVLSSVGLLPAALIGIDITRLLKGAAAMRDRFLSSSWSENVPFQLAAIQYILYQKGKDITVLMPYAQKLNYVTDWYRQLLAESIGKQKDRSGRRVNVGITPVKALGATDQHSQSQLYNEGPYDKLIMFIAVKKLAPALGIPAPGSIAELDYLKRATFNRLMASELEGNRAALTNYNRPHLTITIDRVDAYHLGQLFLLFEGATAFLGELFGVDAFNQPGVELAKVVTRDIMRGKKPHL